MLRSGPRWEAYDAPQTPSPIMVWGQVSFLRSRRIWNEVVMGPRENGGPGRCGCRRVWLEIERTLLFTAYIGLVIDEVSNCSKVYDLE